MKCSSTPTAIRHSPIKRILISLPSEELLHFLNLPNPHASLDPRQRLHIMTPKNNQRSASSSHEHSKNI